MIPYFPPILTAIGPVLAWSATLIFVIAALGCMLFTLRSPRRPLVYAATALLGLALVFVSVPGPSAPPLFRALIGVVVLALSVAGGGPAAQVVLALATRAVVPGANGGIVVEERASADQLASGVRPTHEVLRGGITIGLLERFAATGAIMAGFPEAIAVLVAIKGVGRFTELDAAEARERFIIGTLTSLVWASACAAVFHLAAG